MADEKKTTPEEKKLPETNAVEDDALDKTCGRQHGDRVLQFALSGKLSMK